MKKIILLSALLFACVDLRAWQVNGYPQWYSSGQDLAGNFNYLPDNLNMLRDRFGIEVYINRDPGTGRLPDWAAADKYLESIAKTSESKIIAIWINGHTNTAGISMTDNLKGLFPEAYISALREDIFKNLLGKWYAGDARVLAKVTGTFVYMAGKDSLTPEEMEWLMPMMIKVDDPVYRLGLNPLFNEIVGLFYAEPVSFIFYFPFVTYFLFVRFLGMMYGRKGFWISSLIWGGFMALTVLMIFNRVYIYFPDYRGIFSMAVGFNIPLYICLFFIYNDRIQNAAYNYVKRITGGLNGGNAFEGDKWK
ncbi:MAG: hypothetical protein LLG37_09445 [Spirochaetia bacterium]|nr:hypothetical protein [Spirochaetia bacterium]